MRPEQLDVALAWLWRGLFVLAVMTLWFGAFSASMPSRSIELYQWIMARFNWRVAPIDEPSRRLVWRTCSPGLRARLPVFGWSWGW